MSSPQVQAILDQARQFHRMGQLAEAERLYRQALAIAPEDADALMGLGVVAQQCGAREDALKLMQRAAALRPGVMHFHMNVGEVLRGLGRFDEALGEYERARQISPQTPETHYCTGQMLEKLERFDQAESAYRQAIALRSTYAEAHMNLGVVLERQGRYDQSLRELEEAIRLRPDYPLARMDRAVALLRLGDYEQGWREYEWRFRVRDFALPATNPPRPVWDGSNPAGPAGRTILVRAEQGMGDTLQFARYIPLLAERGARVILETQPLLKTVLARLQGLGGIVAQGEAIPPHDAQVALMSLPRIFGTRAETIPAAVPYLSPEPARVAAWAQRFAGDSSFKVGLAWAGNPNYPGDKRRSASLAAFAPLAATPGVTFYSLQKGDPAAQAANPPAGMRLVNLDPHLNDFADTAAALMHLDLLISVDTSVVHLAGALARPVWTLVPLVPDFRWMLGREDSPWYPTMRLLRQVRFDDWGEVIGRAAGDLREDVKRKT